MKYSRKVIAVSRVSIQNCPSSHFVDSYHVVFDSEPAWQNLSIRTPADLTISMKTEDKQPILTAKLEFRYCGGNTYDRTPSVYLVTLANGSQMVVGSARRPYPVTETSQTISSSNSSSSLITVTVSYSSACEIPFLFAEK